VLSKLSARGDLETAVLTIYPKNAKAVAALGTEQVRWVELEPPHPAETGLTYGGPAATAVRLT
jgi:hypothetical protein